MGREVRKVPENWRHPKTKDGFFIPLLGGSFKKALQEWELGKKMWNNGLYKNWGAKEGEPQWKPKPKNGLSWEEWSCEKPIASDYMPEWSEEEKTHLQMYENITEGTPISLIIKDPKELAHWLADNEVNAFAGMTATYEQWLNTIYETSI